MKSIDILGVRVNCTTLFDLTASIKHAITSSDRSMFPIYTINPEFVIEAQQNNEFLQILNNSWVNVADGVGIIWAANLLGTPLPERITGLHLIGVLTKEAAKHGWKVGFLGGRAGVAEQTKAYFQKKYPKLASWAYTGPWNSNKVSSDMMNKVKKTNILFVAMGAPKQEYFIQSLRKLITDNRKPAVAVGVGGSFDEIAEVVPKTPEWIDQVGMKWLFRLITQPWRWRRQLRLAQFVYLILVDRIKKSLL